MNEQKPEVQIHPLEPTPHPERPLGLMALVTIALGNVFSSSVYALQAPTSAMTGRSAWLAFGLAVIVGFLTILPNLLVSGAVSFKGGDFSLVQLGLGKRASGIFAWNFILMCIGIAISTSAISGYVTTLWPGAPGKIIAIIVTVLIFLLNISPIKAISKAQNIMFYLLCLATATYIIYGLFHIKPVAFDFSAGNYFPNGGRGFIQATTTFCVTTGFYVQVYALALQAKNPRKHIPKSMLITAVIILFLYPLMTFVNVNTLPWEQTVGQTMVGTASSLLPTGLFIFFIICGPILATATTLNAGFLGLSKPFASSAESGWLPKVVGKKNRFGAPYVTLAILLAAAVIPYLFTDNVSVIANQTVLVQSLIKLFPLVAAWRIPTKYPEFWKTGLFRKMPLPVFYIIMGVCTAVQLALFISSMTNLTTAQVVIGLGLFVVLSAIAVIWNAVKGKEIDTSIDYASMS